MSKGKSNARASGSTGSGRSAADAARIIASQCLAIRARRLQRGITRIYDAALREHGLSAAQLGVLVAVTLAPDPQPRNLCAVLDVEKSTLSRNLSLMAAKGWIAIERSGRSKNLALTASGAALLERALPAWQRAQRAAQRVVSRTMADTLRHSWDVS
jgi:DNA-binding MarR family transcriptional regulator